MVSQNKMLRLNDKEMKQVKGGFEDPVVGEIRYICNCSQTGVYYGGPYCTSDWQCTYVICGQLHSTCSEKIVVG